ncbi:hypothetical protein SLS56_005973 [Neofusicoccum ribis]|uniref:Uncharacterized protein n=1 Tax=Neofusicoccum ribis TaxID=45134 RepID=A0ABR3SSS2_9PEZI
MKLSSIFAALAALTGEAAAKAVFAHFMVGNVLSSYSIDKWTSDIKLAQASGIDGFVLNVGTPLNDAMRTQVAAAFISANNLASEFKLFFSFDYEGGQDGPWPAADIVSLMKEYGPNYAYQKASRNGVSLPFVSTFEGGNHAGDWSGIKSQVDVYLVPDWTGSGADVVRSYLNTIDGFFSWDMWPVGASDMSTIPDTTWQGVIGDNKDYMMGVSPWFFTDLKGYGKQRLWRGDDLWADRWEQVQQVNPEYVEIVTWNDYGESHYIGPIWEPAIPQDVAAEADARWYIEGYSHQHWRDLLPYYIARYKNNGVAPAITQEKLTWWYRLAPKAAGTTSVTGNNCAYQTCMDPNDIVQDEIFFTALIRDPANTNVVVQVGDNTPVSHPATKVGPNHFSQPFNGQFGNVTFSIVRNGQGVLSGTGYAIQTSPPNGKRNYNAYVGGVPDTYADL